MPESIFLKLWDGILLHAEPTEKSGDKEFRDSKIKGNLDALRVPLAIAASFAVLLMLLTNAQPSSWLTTLFVVKFAGLAIAVLLLIQSIDANNPLIQNLCSLGGKNNCNAILKSEAAKINSWLTWSEVGFFYFAGSLLTLLLPATSAFASVATLLSYLSLLALPYTVYSISYQYRTGNWCLLCCGIQAVLWLEAVTFILSPFSFNDLSTNGAEIAIITAFAVGFMVPLAIWAFIKPFLLNASQVRPLKNQLKKFKYNSQLFNQVLTSQPRFAVPDKIMPILLGNPEAETVITMVSNPFCGPCAIVHKLLEGWLATRNDIQLKIVFSTANSDDDPRTQVSRHLSALSKLDNKATIELALNAWYESTRKDYADWALKYPVQLDNEQEEVTQHQKEWCDMADITFTPTILINGYKLPDPYRLEDIKYLIA
ncbi:MAG: hypothetical protein EOO89_21870 [Pedobacter sp.]|nr:MAG: hypothetical protein EOO89_21870 [Pedobacter sp.]